MLKTFDKCDIYLMDFFPNHLYLQKVWLFWSSFVGIVVPATIILTIWVIMAHHFATQSTNRSLFSFQNLEQIASAHFTPDRSASSLFPCKNSNFFSFQSCEEVHTEDGLHHRAFPRDQPSCLHGVLECCMGNLFIVAKSDV